jgi:hypothetical protein
LRTTIQGSPWPKGTGGGQEHSPDLIVTYKGETDWVVEVRMDEEMEFENVQCKA